MMWMDGETIGPALELGHWTHAPMLLIREMTVGGR
jgi:hypothetical protein